MMSAAAIEARPLMTHATQRLLGDTISVEDRQWREASALPGWTRGHLATHIARNADALTRLLEGAATGVPVPAYGSEEQREAEIEAGADRTGLELQQDLDTSAELFTEALDRVLGLNLADTLVTVRGAQFAAGDLVLARLAEVVLHHVDLEIGFTLPDDLPTAEALLGWVVRRMATKPDVPAIRLVWPQGRLDLGADPTREVRGSARALCGWLTGRGDDLVKGADGISVPDY